MAIRLFMLNPAIIFAARVNQTSFSYPLNNITFDTVTTGAFGDIEVGMTVLFGSSAGADDYGRQRIRTVATSTVIHIGRSSQGIRTGEIDPIDDAYITVLNDYRVWAKTPYIDAASETTFLDETEYDDQNTENFPVANAGPAHFATIDGGSIITREFDSANSFPVADGATIDTILWDVDDGSITVGTSASAAITATFPAGFRWVSLTVTDSNGKSHTTRVAVYARDPASDTTISNFAITTHRITQSGQRLSLKIFEPIAESTYPDGTLVMIADGEPSANDSHANILFFGWHALDPVRIRSTATATLGDTTLECLDVAGRLDLLPGFPTSCRIANTPDKWEEMVTPDLDKFVHQILQWYSTALDVADFFNSGTGQTYNFSIHGTEGASLWDTVARKYKAMGPDHILTCNTLGQIKCFVDPMLQDTGDRTSTIQATISEADWLNLAFTHRRSPTVHWLWGQAVLSNDDADDIPLAFSVAPGNTPGQGDKSIEHEGLLCPTAPILYATTGHRYARVNAPETTFAVSFAQGDDQAIEPADMTWVKLTITAAHAAQRGLAFSEERGLPLELRIKYAQGRTGLVRTVTMVWERETSGSAAEHWVPPVDVQIPDTGDDWPPVYEDPIPSSDFFDPVKAYIAWHEDGIARTDDIMASPPVWEDVTGSITGFVIDCQYVARPNGNETVGLWCLTAAGMWWCPDILAGTPTWTNKRTLAAIQAAEVTPGDGLAEIRCMANDGGFPGRAILATQPDGSTLSANANFSHAYFHRTDDYGDSWTLCDAADEITHTNSDGTHGHMFTSFYGLDWFRVAGGRIYALRNTTRVSAGSTVETIIMYSDDLGETWTKGHVFPDQSNNWGTGTILNPHPSATSSMFAINGSTGVSNRPNMYAGIDNGDNMTERTDPTGFGGFLALRPNSKHNSSSDEHHVLAWARDNDGSPYLVSLWDSDDGGVTWNEVFDTLQTEFKYQTPNGWPASLDTWFTISTGTTPVIVQMTTDYFATGFGVDKEGNIATVMGGWTEVATRSTVGGIALPKIGANA